MRNTKKEPLDRQVSAKDLAALFGVSQRWIQILTKKGYITKVERGKYQLVAATQGYISFLKSGESANLGPQDMMKEKFRLTKAQADKAEMEVAELEKDLVRVDEVRRVCGDMVTTFKTRILGIPAKIAPMVHGMGSAGEVQACLKRAVTEALQELSGYASR